MGFLEAVFGPSQDEIFRQFAEKIGAEQVPGGLLTTGRVNARVKRWRIVYDTHRKSEGKHSHTYARIRVPYASSDGFTFQIYRWTIFYAIGAFFGWKDVPVGDAAFDDAYVTKGNDKAKVRELLASPELRKALMAQKAFSITVKDDEGWFGKKFPRGVDELFFEERNGIKDVNRLVQLHDIFVALLDRLVAMGSASKEDPGVEL
jgi:hypothetical protein